MKIYEGVKQPLDSGNVGESSTHNYASLGTCNPETMEEGDGNVNGEKGSVSESKMEEEVGRERLKKHRIEVAGRVWIPDIWGQEELLKDWIDCSAFDACLVPKGIVSARAAMVHEGRQANTRRLRVANRC